MPLGRYFFWVGSVLLAMMFVAGWIWPSAAPEPAKEVAAAQLPTNPTNSMMLRIQSARKWPDRIVFDTNTPTIIPPQAVPIVAAIPAPIAPNAAEASALDAHAELKQVAPPAAPPPKRLAKIHHRRAVPSVASAYPPGYPSTYPSTWASASPAAPNWSLHW